MFSKINEMLRSLMGRFEQEEGQTMAEYGLLIALIAVVAAVGATALGLAVSGLLSGISF